MREGNAVRFTKMNGAGNDFILLDAVEKPLGLAPEDIPGLAARLCDRHTGIGADGVILLQRPAGDADVAMRFYNSDGSMGEMCGNGARCACRYAYETGYAGGTVRLETTAGLVTGWRQPHDWFRIRLNTPTVLKTELLLTAGGQDIRCGYAELGDPGIPHLTVELPDLMLRLDGEARLAALRALGRELRYHPALRKGANVNFYQVTGPQHLRQKTYERGVEDFTLACGTGAGALAAVMAASGRMDGSRICVAADGGDLDLEVQMENGRVSGLFLTGAALFVCSGELAGEFLDPVSVEDIAE